MIWWEGSHIPLGKSSAQHSEQQRRPKTKDQKPGINFVEQETWTTVHMILRQIKARECYFPWRSTPDPLNLWSCSLVHTGRTKGKRTLWVMNICPSSSKTTWVNLGIAVAQQFFSVLFNISPLASICTNIYWMKKKMIIILTIKIVSRLSWWLPNW